jgi:hypothetical protein
VSRPSQLAKLSVPKMARVLLRPRLFRRLDLAKHRRVLWIVAPPGAGKTALAATWLRSRKPRHLWLNLDDADGDVATFFHYFALAAEKVVPERGRLPAFTPEYLAAPGGSPASSCGRSVRGQDGPRSSSSTTSTRSVPIRRCTGPCATASRSFRSE